MEPIHVTLLVLVVLFIMFAAGMFLGRDGEVAPVAGAIGAAIVGLLIIIVGYMALMPEYRLWRATIEKRILVEEARAQADSAIELARAEVERAKGTAEANTIVAESITEPYLRYLYINQISETENQIIYLPTEAGLPILEAGRFETNNDD